MRPGGCGEAPPLLEPSPARSESSDRSRFDSLHANCEALPHPGTVSTNNKALDVNRHHQFWRDWITTSYGAPHRKGCSFLVCDRFIAIQHTCMRRVACPSIAPWSGHSHQRYSDNRVQKARKASECDRTWHNSTAWPPYRATPAIRRPRISQRQFASQTIKRGSSLWAASNPPRSTCTCHFVEACAGTAAATRLLPSRRADRDLCGWTADCRGSRATTTDLSYPLREWYPHGHDA